MDNIFEVTLIFNFSKNINQIKTHKGLKSKVKINFMILA